MTGSTFAHHPVKSRFQIDKKTQISGRIQRVEFASPHTYVFVEQLVNEKNVESDTVVWQVEWSSTRSIVELYHITKKQLAKGTGITLTGYAGTEAGSKVFLPISMKTSSGIEWQRANH